ncbi:hypothetical protein Ahy_B09g095463 isoform C [Arachis hypogaea]|uniref:Fe2OG dioxygenase domain-containing protein n=1 Tax=Arachis hypogaea TaxID=3818 RepID=A0A444XE21_ARAHY|nr:hypothetical protein Ahy_B09g095463 isoform C [Arachis hypogaea]
MAPTRSMMMDSPSDLNEFVMIQGNGVKGLYEMGLKTLPKQYIHPLEERMSMMTNKVVPQESIPIIDMSNNNNNCDVEDAICYAAEKWGFFQVINHGVPTQALEYMKKSEALIKRLLNILMKRLNVKEIDEIKEAVLMGSKRINLNYYPVCPNHDLTVAIGRHSDVSTLTILLQDQTGGLFVRTEDRCGWIHVPPIPGALVINIGDALQIMSNGRYKSIEHRVTANGSKTRVSVPIFVNPRPSDVIGPFLEVLASDGEKAKYKNVLYSDYVKHFFRKAHDGKMTIEYAKIT